MGCERCGADLDSLDARFCADCMLVRSAQATGPSSVPSGSRAAEVAAIVSTRDNDDGAGETGAVAQCQPRTPQQKLAVLVTSQSKYFAAFVAYIRRLVQAYPSNDFVYIGIGASCDVVLAGIKEIAPDAQIVEIPFSGTNTTDPEAWRSCQEEQFRAYCAYFLGEVLGQAGKSWLVMDVTSGGTSLKTATRQLRKLRAHHHGAVCSLSLNTLLYEKVYSVTPNEAYRKKKLKKLSLEAYEKKVAGLEFLDPEDADAVAREADVTKAKRQVISEGAGWKLSFGEYERLAYDCFFVPVPRSQYKNVIEKNLDDETYKVLRIYPKVPTALILKDWREQARAVRRNEAEAVAITALVKAMFDSAGGS